MATLLNEVSIALGYGQVQPGNSGSRDAEGISYFGDILYCLDGRVTWGSSAHAPGETINLKAYSLRATLLLDRLTR